MIQSSVLRFRRFRMKLAVRCAALLALVFAALPQVESAEVLNGVKSRGQLRCGVSDDVPGFAERDANGYWRGLEADFCRAVAAAVLNDPEKVDFVPLQTSARFPARCRRAGSTCCSPTPRGPSPAKRSCGCAFPASSFTMARASWSPPPPR